jgi:ABC-2 type transport system ATP-binding protein
MSALSSEPGRSIIEVDRLTKRYKRSEINALDQVSFRVEAGSFFALLGPNGAGKTTAISILTTSLLPSSGSVRIAGFDVVRDSAAVRSRIGILFQKPSLDLNLTAEENVRMHAVLYGLYPFRPTYSLMPTAYKRRIQELAEMLGIADDIFRPLKRFSGGMQRKLEIVRSLMHDPRILYLDEPTAGLDAASRRTLWSYLNQVRHERDTTVFLTTHYIEEAEQADHIAILDKGKIVSDGTPSQVKSELVRDYLVLDTRTQDRDRLLKELDRLDLMFEQSFPVRISLNGHSVQQLIKSIDTPLSSVQTLRPTLEEAYLQILEDQP